MGLEAHIAFLNIFIVILVVVLLFVFLWGCLNRNREAGRLEGRKEIINEIDVEEQESVYSGMTLKAVIRYLKKKEGR